MPGTRFTVLTGHLSQYPLADLIGILRHQRKTGRLLIEYIGTPAILFFKNGDLVDAQYNSLVGVQAIFVAFVQPPAAFNFNPLIQPTRYSIDVDQQRVILELLGCWIDDAIAVKSTVVVDEVTWDDVVTAELPAAQALLAIPPSDVREHAVLGEVERVLALNAGPPEKSAPTRAGRPAWVLATATLGLLLILGVPTLIVINSKARSLPLENNISQPTSAPSEPVTPAASVNETSQEFPKAKAEGPGGVVDKSRERDSNDQRQVSDETQATTGMKETTTVPPPAKETAQPEAKLVETEKPAKTTQEPPAGQTVKIVMRIENGRVVQATVGNRRPGAEAYESLALRIARQRRYPAGVNRQETLLMKVDGPK